MARKNVVSAFPMITDGDMSSDITSEITDVKHLDVATIRLQWTTVGTPVGVVNIQALQEKDGITTSDADWFNVDLDAVIVIDNTESEHQILFEQLPFDKIRLKYNRTSGTGTMNAKISAKQVGG